MPILGTTIQRLQRKKVERISLTIRTGGLSDLLLAIPKTVRPILHTFHMEELVGIFSEP